jgi:hypothetical protein
MKKDPAKNAKIRRSRKEWLKCQQQKNLSLAAFAHFPSRGFE